VRIHRTGRHVRGRVKQVLWKNRILAGTAALAVVLGGSADVAATAMTASANGSASVSSSVTTICGKDQHIVTTPRVDIRNNNWQGMPMCLTNHGLGANFTITASGLDEPWAAYPNAFVGCEISVCSPHNPMPIEVSNIRQAYSSWQYHPGGPWTGNAAYDIWFNPTPMTTGQVNHGTEIMLWLDASHVGHSDAPLVSIDGTRWHFDTWTTHHGSLSWHYVRFWRATPTLSVTNLNLQPFFAYTESRGLLKTTWYLTAVEAGYELWQGAIGMQTKNFSVLVTPWNAHVSGH
jgi:Glycosyl hydrolase family 12